MGQFLPSLVVFLVAYCHLTSSNVVGDFQSKEELEKIVSHQKTQLEHQDEINQLRTLKLRNNLVQSANIYPRSCQEIFDLNPALFAETNGPQWIDPDGPSVGDPPVLVQCSNGTTTIGHDSEAPTEVAPICANEGCYTKNITYDTTIRQMSALGALSTECSQTFKYDCQAAYFQFYVPPNKLEQYSWWVDRYGEKQYFWSGKFIDGAEPSERHICQSGIDQNCEDDNYLCNCDIVTSVGTQRKTDFGTITEKGLLPVTQLKLGKIEGSAVFTLGKFQCRGSFGPSILEPVSCRDLYQLGQTINGFYTVLGRATKEIETVFCNFRLPAVDPGFETRIGILCTGCGKANRVYFNVQDSVRIEGADVVISFSDQLLNEGDAMNMATGVFTAPVDGIYYFAFSGQKCANNFKTSVYLKLNYMKTVAMASSDDFKPNPFTEKCSFESTLRLKRGDTLNLVLDGCIQDSPRQDSGPQATRFNGWLLEEEY